MKKQFEQKVYYGDTDAYGVAWHGSYIHWLEKGRTDFLESIGFSAKTLMEQDIATPLANLNIKYKLFAMLDDDLIVETAVAKITPLCVTFEQIIKKKENDKVCVVAHIDVVTVNKEGKLYRRIPQNFYDALKNTIKE